MKAGVYPDMSNEEYHSYDSLGSTGISHLMKTPYHYWWAANTPSHQTKAMLIGSMTHTMVLEPDKFDDEYYVGDVTKSVIETINTMDYGNFAVYDGKVRRGKAYHAFAQENPRDIILKSNYDEAIKIRDDLDGKTIITPSDHADVLDIRDAVMANPVARKIIEADGPIERSIFWEDFETGISCKCRPDKQVTDKIYDFKTTQNVDDMAFAYSCRKFGYHRQDAWYSRGAKTVSDISQFGFIAVSTIKPYMCTVFHSLAEEDILLGESQCNSAVRLLAECLEKDEWPKYPDEYDVLSLSGGGLNKVEF